MRKSDFIKLTILAGILVIVFFFWIQMKERELIKEEDSLPKTENYENAWILTVQDGKLLVYAQGKLREYEAVGLDAIQEIMTEANMAHGVMADVVVEDEKVKKVSLKTDTIEGKVLAIGEEFIEIQGYGKVPLSPSYAFYKDYDVLEEVSWTEILVGYEGQSFIVGNGQICGAIISTPIIAKNIRVLIMTDQYQGDYHEVVRITSESPYLLETKKESKTYEANEILELKADSNFFEDGRLTISPIENGKLSVLSVERSNATPSYHGRLELAKEGDHIILINELSLEEYLYSVVPSEMPPSYGLEALKAQAVCARSYAYKHILKNSLSTLGAHVNDSAKYQVYNNLPEHELSTQAVDETKGQILVSGEEVVEAYYFSTSCGHTTDSNIWGNNVELSYISGKLLSEQSQELDLTNEDTFTEFIKDNSLETFENNFPWYRWNVYFSLEDLTNLMKKNMGNTYVDKVKRIEVSKRGTGGVATELTVIGNKSKTVIETEYNIRTLLVPYGFELVKNDGTITRGFNLLPSAFFILEEIKEDNQLQGYKLYGGGFGHGAGMSQNGVKSMAEKGKTYIEILVFFYTGVEIQNYLTR